MTVPKIDQSKINRSIGASPDLEFVAVDMIDVDNNYQRPVKNSLVKRILRSFKWDRFGAVVLARKNDGRFFVVEGQHRVTAAQLHPDVERVPAVIFKFISTAQEAESFVGINRDRLSVNSIDRYWAALTAGDETAHRVSRVLKEAECDVVPEHGARKPNLTHAVTAVERAMKNCGDAAVIRALKILRLTWPADKDALRGTLISSVSALVRINPDVDDEAIAQVLRAQSYKDLTASAEAIRKLAGGSSEMCLRRAICDLYNRGRRKGFLEYRATG